MAVYYGKTIPQQMQGKYTRPAAGLNEYNPTHDMNDNLLSECLDATPYLESGTRLYASPANTAPMNADASENDGTVLISIADSIDATGEHIVSLVNKPGVADYIVDYFVPTGAYTRIDVSAVGIDAALTGFDKISVCRYATEAATYVVFAVDSLEKLVWYDYTTFGSVDLSFYPTQIVSHANRIFALDDKNTLWWSRAGAPFNIAPMTDSWYSAISESTVLEDAGYWVVERERILEDMCVLNDAIYLFGRQNIYVFQGTNYDTFNLSIIVSDFGIRGDQYVTHLCTSRNMAYLIDDGNVYEFNGQSAPRLISHSIFVNTGLTNGVLGGIAQTDLTHIAANRDTVYVYQKWHYMLTEDIVYREYIYEFDIKTRTWWKVSGFNTATTTLDTLFKVQIVPSYDMASVYSVVSEMDATRKFYIYNIVGTLNGTPYIVTKAFNTNPSNMETLTSIILQLKGTKDTTADLRLLYSLKDEEDDFIEFWHHEDYIFNGDLENIYVPVPVSIIANSHHYRIKLEVSGSAVIVYNIERRFRTRGLSR